jgi:hypothetical protein
MRILGTVLGLIFILLTYAYWDCVALFLLTHPVAACIISACGAVVVAGFFVCADAEERGVS